MSKAIPPSILGLVLLALSCPVAWGGGSKEDYERADTLVRRYEGRVLNEELELTWVDAERAVYRRQMSSDAWQWMLVDAEAGTRAEAFDHAAVARKFAKILGSSADRGRIRLTPLEVKDGRLLVLSGARALAIDLATSAVEVLDLKDVDLLRLPPVKADRSKNGGKETAILFVNATEGPVKVVWLDLEGKPHEYATVAAGASQRQHTYAGHVWRVEGADGTSLSTFRARGEIGVAFVRGEAPDPAAAKPKTTPRKPRGTSPDGRWRVFVREHDVYLEDLSGGGTRRLTSDGKAEDGYASRVSWSPSSRTVMVWRSEPGVDHRVYAVDSVPDDRFEPRLRSWNYLKPGDRIPVRRPHLFDVERGERIDLPDDLFPTPCAISHVSWAPEGERFRFLYNERGHQVLRFLELDAEAEKVRTLIEETSETFVDYSQKTFLDPLKPGDRWAWMSERSGTNHLYLLDAETGELTPDHAGRVARAARARPARGRRGGCRQPPLRSDGRLPRPGSLPRARRARARRTARISSG